MSKLDRQKTIETIQLLEEQRNRVKYNQLKFYSPYKKQFAFHNDVASERMLGAGNQVGKTLSGSREAAYHATGLYPDWWEGTRFKKPTVGWVGGVSGEVIRDTTQKLLVGRMQDIESIGSEAIPKDCIIETSKAMGVKDLLDHVKIKHVSGGISLIFFKSYEKGREKFQGETIDWVWLDEEPPQEIYTECLTRTNNGQLGQFIFITFTPLKGMTTVAFDFYSGSNPTKHLTQMSIDDVDHYTPEEKEKIKASYPEHEREARSHGYPTVGEGRIFLTPEADIKQQLQSFPSWFPHIAGQDFGYGQSEASHPTALACMAWDRERDIINVYDAFYVKQPTPIKTAGTLRARHPDKIDWIPISWPHDAMKASGGNEKGTIAELHKAQGMQMLPHHATFEDGGNSVEAGIMDMDQRMSTGRLKVAAHLDEWFDEYRMYHREKGKIVKLRDDLMSATRYGIMMLRYADTEPVEEYETDDYNDIGCGGY
jgi:phage terminase large subunit-like protein